ncbi:uncharacterized protein AMSG_00664 [Thecamonas trahens ATCC 50062]|uniref:RUN domain-containing protein n=1 Tax=Thecamonas trahens ATCC 50062 TaxID=461836 RepID=A0A0L0DGP5_THETB|nr:hypothetical protein AMSG_00664 [Thecamonas trahens ATCC 50062]KNC50503.1 hypothetical protein AMSG_00664 [Thecamonas trahens ATCC 50062]|eukprot:XP_013762396.1 hypothetical protein AMSG_00664 [Thecamonas trahens ATCC 50062]
MESKSGHDMLLTSLRGLVNMMLKSHASGSGKHTSVVDAHPLLRNLCVALEQILSHGIKHAVPASRFKRKGAPLLWAFLAQLEVCDGARGTAAIQTIRSLELLKTDADRVRALIKYALVEGSLDEYLQALLDVPDGIQTYYEPHALMASPEHAPLLVSFVVPLKALNFDLDMLDVQFEEFERPAEKTVVSNIMFEVETTPGRSPSPTPQAVLSPALAARKDREAQPSPRKPGSSGSSGRTRRRKRKGKKSRAGGNSRNSAEAPASSVAVIRPANRKGEALRNAPPSALTPAPPILTVGEPEPEPAEEGGPRPNPTLAAHLARAAAASKAAAAKVAADDADSVYTKYRDPSTRIDPLAYIDAMSSGGDVPDDTLPGSDDDIVPEPDDADVAAPDLDSVVAAEPESDDADADVTAPKSDDADADVTAPKSDDADADVAAPEPDDVDTVVSEPDNAIVPEPGISFDHTPSLTPNELGTQPETLLAADGAAESPTVPALAASTSALLARVESLLASESPAETPSAVQSPAKMPRPSDPTPEPVLDPGSAESSNISSFLESLWDFGESDAAGAAAVRPSAASRESEVDQATSTEVDESAEGNDAGLQLEFDDEWLTSELRTLNLPTPSVGGRTGVHSSNASSVAVRSRRRAKPLALAREPLLLTAANSEVQMMDALTSRILAPSSLDAATPAQVTSKALAGFFSICPLLPLPSLERALRAGSRSAMPQATSPVAPPDGRSSSRPRAWTPPRLRIIVYEEPPEAEARAIQCYGCGTALGQRAGLLRRKASGRLCTYFGRYLCSAVGCWTPAGGGSCSSIIPAKLLARFDTHSYPISALAAQFLDSVADEPAFDIAAINSSLYSLSKPLSSLRHYRSLLKEMRSFLTTCTSGVAAAVDDMVDDAPHLVSDPDLYSLADLLASTDGSLMRRMIAVRDKVLEHVASCPRCSALAMTCSLCDARPLYPFDEPHAYRCEDCNALFHIGCMRRIGNACPNCASDAASLQRIVAPAGRVRGLTKHDVRLPAPP